jgi:hypothetical protein
MQLHLERIEDKVEFFEASSLSRIEHAVNEKIDHNKALLLEVQHVSHSVTFDQNGKRLYSAVVHFKAKK